MVFPSKVSHWANATLKHDAKTKELYAYFVSYNLQKKNVPEKDIKSLIQGYKSVFCNHYVETSHYVNFISNNRLAEKERGRFFEYLLIYLKQFYPELEMTKSINNASSLRELFNQSYKKMEQILLQFLDSASLDGVQNNIDTVNRIQQFYGLIEDFLIRFYNYSIVEICNQEYIVTSHNDCNKRFIDELMQGYSLYRMQKVGLKGEHYEFLPVLPTRDVGFPIEELIETPFEETKIDKKVFVKIQ